MDDRDEGRAVLADGGGDPARLEHRPPLRLDGAHIRPAALRDLAEEMTEAPEDRDQHPVPGGEQGDHGRLDSGPGGPVHEERPAVVGAKDLAVQRHHLVHVRGERRVELPRRGMDIARRTRGSASTGPGPISRRGGGFSSSKTLRISCSRVSGECPVPGQGADRRQFSQMCVPSPRGRREERPSLSAERDGPACRRDRRSPPAPRRDGR